MKLAEKNANYRWCYEQHSSIFESVKVCSIDFEKNQSVGRTVTISRQTKFQTPPVAANYGSNVGGEGASVFANVFYTPRSVDLMGLPYQNPVTGESIYYRQNNSIQHPLWTVNNTANIQNTNRVFGGANISYGINDNLNVS